MKTPATTADPITPATFGPMAWGSRKFWGLALCPMLWDKRAAMGTADTPAEPMSGLIFSLTKRFITLAKMSPLAVLKAKAPRPKPKIFMVSRSKTRSDDS